MRAFSSRIGASACGQPLFHGSTSHTATGSPSAEAALDHRAQVAAASSTGRPCAMSLIPPCTISTSASAHGFVEPRRDLVGALAPDAEVAKLELGVTQRRPVLPLALGSPMRRRESQ